METSFSQKVFFYTTSQEGSPEGAYFQDLIVNLAEGFQALGIQFYSSNNYWKLFPNSDRCLLQNNPNINHFDCDIVVLERQWFEENGCLPKDLFKSSRKYITVYLDCSDGLRTFSYLPEFRNFDFIFKAHCNENIEYPSNVYPWAFGLSSRVINELSSCPAFEERQKSILVNFRHQKFSHSLRRFSQKFLIPNIHHILSIDSSSDDLKIPPQDPYHYLKWAQTGRRHYPSYYKRLSNSMVCACFGGYFLAPGFTDANYKLSYYLSKLISEFSEFGFKTNRIGQWDSWRFWESMAAGCVTFHVDFEKYGFQLPVIPKNWEHYIGVDLDNIQEAIDRITDHPEILKKVANQGRDWVLDNYSPRSTALRFMKTVVNT